MIIDTEIQYLLPHEEPMLLLDKAIEGDEHSMICELEIKEDNLFFNEGSVGAWVGIEYMAQTIAAHVGLVSRIKGEKVKIGYLLGTRNYRCSLSSFALGTKLKVVVKMEYEPTENGVGAYQCAIFCENKEVANAICSVYQLKNDYE